MNTLLERDEVEVLPHLLESAHRTSVVQTLLDTSPKRTPWVISKPERGAAGTTGSFLACADAIQGVARIPEIAVPLPPPKQTSSRLLGMWEAYVTSIEDQVFTARLIDLKGNDPDHEAEFDIASVSDFDLDLLEVGAVFYWSITYIHSLAGQRSTTSDIRFRRRPVWSAQDLRNPEKEAEFAAVLGL